MNADKPLQTMQRYGCSENDIAHYTCMRVPGPINIDGNLDKPVWQKAIKSPRFDVPEFDLLSRKALTFGGDYDRHPESFWWGRHPRKCRWAFLDWDFPGLQTAVRVDGKINDNRIPDKGWSVELAFPWEGMKWLKEGRSLLPEDGDTWRIFFGRFQRLCNAGNEVQPHPAWAWNKHGVYDTHLPECFTKVHFSNDYLQLD
jgi:hypothetical protein